MNEAFVEREKAFLRWLAKGPLQRAQQFRKVMDTFVPLLEVHGFKWVEKDIDGHRAQVNSITLERRRDSVYDFIVIIFDKYRKPKFKIIMGTKELAPPHKWVRGGSLVRYKSELDRAKWWSPMWWQPNKVRAFDQCIHKVSQLTPQIIDFLSKGAVGSHVWKSEIGGRPK